MKEDINEVLFLGVIFNKGETVAFYDRVDNSCVYIEMGPTYDYMSETENDALKKRIDKNPERFLPLPRFEDFDFNTTHGTSAYNHFMDGWRFANEV